MIRSFTRKAAFAACLSFLTAASAYAGSPTVLDVAKQKGNFNTLAKAIEVAGLQQQGGGEVAFERRRQGLKRGARFSPAPAQGIEPRGGKGQEREVRILGSG